MARRAYEAFAQRDREALVALADPEIEIHAVTNLIAGREGPYRGHAGIDEYLHDVATHWDEVEIQAHQFVELEDERVLALGRVRSRRGATRMDMPNAWLWQFADTKVRAVHVLVDTESIAGLLAARRGPPSA